MSDALVTVGRVGRPHGVDGAFFVEGASDAPERFARGAVLLVDGEPAEIVVSKRGAGGRLVIKLDRDSAARRHAGRAPRGAARARRGRLLRLPARRPRASRRKAAARSVLVSEVVTGPANDKLALDSGMLVPLVEYCVLDIDLDEGRILVARGFADADG